MHYLHVTNIAAHFYIYYVLKIHYANHTYMYWYIYVINLHINFIPCTYL